MIQKLFMFIAVLGFLKLEKSMAQKAFVISGGGHQDNKRYQTITKTAINYFENNNSEEIKIFAGDGQNDRTWKFHDDIMAATSKQRILYQLSLSLKKLKENETLSLFVTDHGMTLENQDNQNLDTTAIVLTPATSNGKSDFITHRELTELIKAHKPKNTSVRMLGIHCFSGGLMEVASEIPGVCGSSSTNDEKTTISESDINLHGQGFLKNTKKSDKLSLEDNHFEAMKNDYLNHGRNQLSTQAYIEKLIPEFDQATYLIPQAEIDFMSLFTTNKDISSKSTFYVLDQALLQKNDHRQKDLNICNPKKSGAQEVKNQINSVSQFISADSNSVNSNDQNSEKMNQVYNSIKLKSDSLIKKVTPKIVEDYEKIFLDSKKEYEDLIIDYNAKSEKVNNEIKFNESKNQIYKNARLKMDSLFPLEDAYRLRHLNILKKALESNVLSRVQKEHLVQMYECEQGQF